MTSEAPGEAEQRVESSMIGRIIGERWRVIEAMGPIPRGEAFRCKEVEHGREARVELWDAREAAERGRPAQLEREARIVSRLQHPRCLTLFQFGIDDGRPFYAWEPGTGRTLRDELGKPELTVARSLAIVLQVLEGLRHLHAHGVVHRALTPDNVVLGTSLTGEVVWVGPPQMGAGTGAAATAVAEADRIFQPPERRALRPDHRGDLYAAGMLLYVMCAGLPPPPGGAPPPPRTLAPEREISEAVERIIMKAIARSPDARFQSADELIAAVQMRAPVPARAPRPPAPPKISGRMRLAILAGGTAAIALCGLALLLRGGGASRPAPAVTARPSPPETRPSPPETRPTPPPPVEAPRPPPVVEAPRPAPPVSAAAPAVEPIEEPPPPPPAVPRPVPAKTSSAGVPPDAERAEIWALLQRWELTAADQRITPLIARHPEAAWPHLARGELYFRRYWRRNAVIEWERALERDATLAEDPAITAHLCEMLDARWEAAGVHRLLARLGPRAAQALDRCVAAATSPGQRALAQRARARLKTL